MISGLALGWKACALFLYDIRKACDSPEALRGTAQEFLKARRRQGERRRLHNGEKTHSVNNKSEQNQQFALCHKMTNRRLIDPRLHYTFRLTGAEYHVIFKHWPAPGDSPGGKQILRSDWMRRMMLLAADCSRSGAEDSLEADQRPDTAEITVNSLGG